ncbi:MAG: DmsC/YnfH family molybdoenzyme membrane anchor subunit [Dongiaceae bacterium]
MHPALSVILFTTVAGAGYGLLGLLCGLGATGLLPQDRWLAIVGFALGLLAVTFGLIASTFHLGRPARAWRAFFYWPSSWLSREAVLSLATLIPAAFFLYLWLAGRPVAAPPARGFGLVAAGLALLTVLATAMIYASLKPVRAWRNIWVVPNYLLLGTMTGALWLAALLHGFGQARPWQSELLVLLILAAWLGKLLYWHSIRRGSRRSTPESATGLGRIGRVRSFERPHTADNYLLKEMGFAVARKHADKLRRIASLAAFLAPAVLTVIAAVAPRWLATAAALLGAGSAIFGVLIERWLFFAEARHAVTLYYGAEAA